MQTVLKFDREWLVRWSILSTAYANLLGLKRQRLLKKGLLWQWGTTFDRECKKNMLVVNFYYDESSPISVTTMTRTCARTDVYTGANVLIRLIEKAIGDNIKFSDLPFLDWFNCLVKMFSKIKRQIVRCKDKKWIRLSSAESCYLINYILRVHGPYSINECSTIGFEGMEIP